MNAVKLLAIAGTAVTFVGAAPQESQAFFFWCCRPRVCCRPICPPPCCPTPCAPACGPACGPAGCGVGGCGPAGCGVGGCGISSYQGPYRALAQGTYRGYAPAPYRGYAQGPYRSFVAATPSPAFNAPRYGYQQPTMQPLTRAVPVQQVARPLAQPYRPVSRTPQRRPLVEQNNGWMPVTTQQAVARY